MSCVACSGQVILSLNAPVASATNIPAYLLGNDFHATGLFALKVSLSLSHLINVEVSYGALAKFLV